jgi:hypothetical protein
MCGIITICLYIHLPHGTGYLLERIADLISQQTGGEGTAPDCVMVDVALNYRS